MFCDPCEVLRQRIHLVIERTVGKLRRFVDEFLVPYRVLRELDQAALDGPAMLAQALDFVADGRDQYQLHTVLRLDV